ncbi:hypothetical protein STRAU_5359 [Streptomyces aurantiacus JA 4570]|uniref:Uncharacterized protein n=1 Tax=Streptomyces aurantiacus JA 4570 TaxID=1286094 RepID=S3ZT67_9ACTN|nr:hypothetical protein STRAU_5359 [Streptomyces aurantiacus JA 4570]
MPRLLAGAGVVPGGGRAARWAVPSAVLSSKARDPAISQGRCRSDTRVV